MNSNESAHLESFQPIGFENEVQKISLGELDRCVTVLGKGASSASYFSWVSGHRPQVKVDVDGMWRRTMPAAF